MRSAAPLLALALVAAPVLTACADDDATVSRPASDADRGGVLTSGAPADAATTAPATAPTSTPTPVSSTPDGTLYALVRGATATTLTYDKIDHQKAACDALAPKQPVPVAQGFAACFTNVNPLTRTVPISPTAEVLVIREGDPPAALAPSELLAFVNGDANTAPVAYSSFRITVSGGRATRIEQFGVSDA